jgi:hypothetical protein
MDGSVRTLEWETAGRVGSHFLPLHFTALLVATAGIFH